MFSRRAFLRAAAALGAALSLPEARAQTWSCPPASGAAAARIAQAKAAAARDSLGSLPRLRIPAQGITVSGISSGGAMAMQLHVAHSARIRGAGIFAAPAYACALSDTGINSYYFNANRAQTRCMENRPDPVPVQDLVARIGELAAARRIDPVAELRQSKAWLLTSPNDPRVLEPAMKAVEAVYRALIPLPDNVVLRDDIPVGHGWPTPAADSDPGDKVDECAATAPPYFNPCRFSATRAMLEFVLGRAARESVAPGKLIKFDQRPFRTGGLVSRGLGEAGYLCLPERIDGDTRIHIVFHGCCQSIDELGNLFPIESEFVSLANAFNLVVLFPQAEATLFNPKGCWDWWGYSEPFTFGSDASFDYPTQCGAQIRAVMRMVEQISGEEVPLAGVC